MSMPRSPKLTAYEKACRREAAEMLNANTGYICHTPIPEQRSDHLPYEREGSVFLTKALERMVTALKLNGHKVLKGRYGYLIPETARKEYYAFSRDIHTRYVEIMNIHKMRRAR